MNRAKLKRAVTPAIVGGAAMATAATVVLATAVPQVVSRESVELTATITPGSATNWNAAGIDKFYGVNWNGTYGETVIAPFRLVEFWQGAENILKALDTHAGDGVPDVVVSSGRGAGNASAAITWLAATDPDGARLNDTFWILDNNVDRPNGGYATRYPFFAFVGVNPVPVPNDLEGVQILDVGYQYAWNSSAPTYISNLPALLNAIIAYAYRYRQQDKLPIPTEILNADGTLNTEAIAAAGPGYYIVHTDGSLEHRPFDDPDSKVTTVYLTYAVDGLPMLKPIRDFGGDLGNAFADVVEPLLTVLVNASYTNNDPFSDPSVYTPMRLIAPPKVWIKAAHQLPAAITEGWENLQKHLGGGPSAPDVANSALPQDDPAQIRQIETPKAPATATPETDADAPGHDLDGSEEEPAERTERTRTRVSDPITERVRDAANDSSKRRSNRTAAGDGDSPDRDRTGKGSRETGKPAKDRTDRQSD